MPADVGVTTSYRPGDWVAVVVPGVWLLVAGSAGDSLLREAWDAARGADGPAAVEQLLRGEPAKATTSFALVVLSGTGLVVLLAGEAVAEAGARGEMRCPGGVSVAEYRLAELPPHLSIRGGTVRDHTGLPLDSGIVPAGVVRLEWTDREISLSAEAQGASALPETSHVQSAPYAFDAGATLSSLSPLDLTTIDDAPPAPETGSSDEGYDHLFGHTVSRTVEGAAVRQEDAEASCPPESLPPVDAPSRPLPHSAELPSIGNSPPAPTPVQRAATSGMIDAVPWSSDAELPSPPLAALRAEDASDEDDEAFGLTVNRAAQKALLEQVTADASSSSGPGVHAVRCPAQHPNPVYADTCRVCGASVDEQAPVTIPPPGARPFAAVNRRRGDSRPRRADGPGPDSGTIGRR